jgi:hypothetical protein
MTNRELKNFRMTMARVDPPPHALASSPGIKHWGVRESHRPLA